MSWQFLDTVVGILAAIVFASPAIIYSVGKWREKKKKKEVEDE